ncbi:metal ABC transporter substrate-binding protein [Primorskyibacter sp. S187A]|uniref:metal ABC transporter substrate-binding protein n=1 Tax=Primorskyibacter sp. S187A TaxID=3415130 RepID=UPI003C7AA70E
MGRSLRQIVATFLVLCVASASTAQETPRVVTVNQALSLLSERLLDADGEVVFPVPEGVDPSFWRPSIADISMIQSSDLIVLNGAGFASWIDRVSLPRSRLVNSSAGLKDEYITTESITHSHGEGGEHSHEGVASYLWLDPSLAIGQAEAVARALGERGFVPPDALEARLDALRADLMTLDEETKRALERAQDVPMIATHPRYQYFARRFGLSIASLEWDAGAMPTQDELAVLDATVRENGARILIWEAQPPQAAIAAADALGLKSVVFDPMANKSDVQSFVQSYRDAVSDLSEAVVGSLN